MSRALEGALKQKVRKQVDRLFRSAAGILVLARRPCSLSYILSEKFKFSWNYCMSSSVGNDALKVFCHMQIEFYFSDSNAPRDTFLMEKIKSHPEVDFYECCLQVSK